MLNNLTIDQFKFNKFYVMWKQNTTVEKVRKPVKKLQNNRASGPAGINSKKL